MLRFSLVLVVIALLADSISAEQIDVVTCDVLPVVEVQVSGSKFHFLVDTAATSILNIQSFASGEAKTVSVTSWSGTADAKAKQVRIADLSVGDHHFHNLVLPAVDLSGIGHACGREINGILGIDLLRELGAVVDLRDHTPRLRIDTETTQSRMKELNERIVSCERAFNHGDQAALSDCLDPEVVIFSSAGDFHGRESVMESYRMRYSSQRAVSDLSLKPCVYHVLGEAIWIEWEFDRRMGEKTATLRGTALWSNANGKWRIAHLNLDTRDDNAIAVSRH